MLFSDTIGISISGLRRNKSRSLMTTLGIIIGVGSVVLMVSMGASFERYILDQIESFGGNTIDIYPKGMERVGKALDTLKYGDYEALTTLSTVKNVAPVIFVAEPIQYLREEVAPFIFGTRPEIFSNYGQEIEEGRFLSQQDEKGAKNVMVLGGETANDLFETVNPLGKRLTIGNRKFTVVGVLKTQGSLISQELDKAVYIPFSVAKAMTQKSNIDYISLQAKGDGELALADIRSLLRQRHRIHNPENDPDKDDFLARSSAQAADVIGQVTLGITAFLAIVAGISLIVGGIGIMNIMLVSVSERTKEIGLRKAVGAKKQDILLQFLLEAVFLTMIGGIIGVLGGLGLGFLLSLVASRFLGEFPFALSWPAVLVSLLMAGGTGLVFGIYPARKAANLSPMEAMRWE